MLALNTNQSIRPHRARNVREFRQKRGDWHISVACHVTNRPPMGLDQRRSCIYAVTPWRAHRRLKKKKRKEKMYC